jgi:hypothetical protein
MNGYTRTLPPAIFAGAFKLLQAYGARIASSSLRIEVVPALI